MKTVEMFLTENRRQEIFRALVEAQDKGQTVLLSRTKVAKKFAVTEKQMDGIERDGIDGDWPPL